MIRRQPSCGVNDRQVWSATVEVVPLVDDMQAAFGPSLHLPHPGCGEMREGSSWISIEHREEPTLRECARHAAYTEHRGRRPLDESACAEMLDLMAGEAEFGEL